MTETRTAESREFTDLFGVMGQSERVKTMTFINAAGFIMRLSPSEAVSFNTALTAMGQMFTAGGAGQEIKKGT